MAVDSRKLPDPIADMKPTGKVLKRLQEMARKQEDSARNV